MTPSRPPEVPEPFAPGTVIVEKYRIERVVGRGGMGQVFAATHVALDERVAIKLLLPAALAMPEVVVRFRREAQASVRLRSEHVCRVLDVGETEATGPFIVMEFLEGRDLSTMLREKIKAGAVGLPLREAVSYVLQAAEGLSEAHALGIVHRDVKPANLFRAKRADGSPCVKVLDFGIAKIDDSQHQLTQVMGSVDYMSPEQAQRGRTVDARSDVWSLAAVLYQLLSGKAPFERELMHETIAAIVTDQPAPLEGVRSDLPVGLPAVVMRGLRKNREERFASMADFADALAPFGGTAGARQAVRVRAVFEERKRASLSPATALPAEVAAPSPTRFDLVTQAVVPAAPRPPAHPVRAFALPFAILCLAGGLVYSARAREPASPAASTARVAEPASAAAAAASGETTSVPAASASSDQEAQKPGTRVPSSVTDAAPAPTTVVASARVVPSKPATRERSIATNKPASTSATEASGDAVAKPPTPAAKAAASPPPSPCRNILTDEPIPCR